MIAKLIAMVMMGFTVLAGIAGYDSLKGSAEPSASTPAPQVDTGLPVSILAATTGSTVYTIQPGSSKASSTLEEVLFGRSNTVVGATRQVSGQIAVDPSALSQAQVGSIQVDTASLVTDDNQRNRMIRQFVLSASQNPTIQFTPRAISGLPDSMALGTAYPLQIDGQLTIKGVSQPASFAATVTPVSASQLTGTATATINRSNWGLTIPQVPSVASVSNSVRLDLSFVATAVS